MLYICFYKINDSVIILKTLIRIVYILKKIKTSKKSYFTLSVNWTQVYRVCTVRQVAFRQAVILIIILTEKVCVNNHTSCCIDYKINWSDNVRVVVAVQKSCLQHNDYRNE